MSNFTKIMKKLVKYSEKIDKNNINEDDFAELQVLDDEICKRYNNKEFAYIEKDILFRMYNLVEDSMRSLLK